MKPHILLNKLKWGAYLPQYCSMIFRRKLLKQKLQIHLGAMSEWNSSSCWEDLNKKKEIGTVNWKKNDFFKSLFGKCIRFISRCNY